MPKKVTREQVLQAYQSWVSEDNRDRGWDYDLVRELRNKYYGLKEKYEDQEGYPFHL